MSGGEATQLSADEARIGPDGHSVARRQWIAALLVLGSLWLVPLLSGGFLLYLGIVIAIYATAALGLQLMVGLAGQLSLGHAAFLGLGAYTSVILQKQFGLPYFVTSLAAALVAAIAGLLMAQLIRLSGIYFKIATFGFGVIVFQILQNWSSVTGGHTGIIGVPRITLFGFDLNSLHGLLVIACGKATIVYLLFLRLSQGRAGRAFRALGQNEDAARSIGVNVVYYKMAVIVIGCTVAGWIGSLLPHLYLFISPEYFTWHESLVLLIMITVGGLGSLPGAVIGAAVLVAIPEYLRDFAEYKMLAYGALLILSMTFLPNGIMGAIAAAGGRLARRGGARGGAGG